MLKMFRVKGRCSIATWVILNSNIRLDFTKRLEFKIWNFLTLNDDLTHISVAIKIKHRRYSVSGETIWCFRDEMRQIVTEYQRF